jgi:hypothetical protein
MNSKRKEKREKGLRRNYLFGDVATLIGVQFPSPALSPEHIDFRTYLRKNIRECTTESYIERLQRLSRIGNLQYGTEL